MFDKALQSSSLCHRSSTLWLFNIAFEMRRRSSTSRLDSLLFRALQACPWSKEIYMILAKSQSSESVDKLQDAVDMIVEKGLRLFTLVDELETFHRQDSLKG